MKTLAECLDIVIKDQKAPFRACLDCGRFYMFNFSKPDSMTGSEFPIVDKNTGRLSYFSVASNPKIFMTAKNVTSDVNKILKGASNGK